MAYNGIDRSDAFFAHYGRKGMKRGMNIFNPDYKPIGEKAKGAMTGDPRYFNSPKISVTGIQSSAKDSAREAYEAASTMATSLSASAEKLKKEKENATKKAKEAMEKAASAATFMGANLQNKEKMKKLLDAEKARAAEKARFYIEDAKKKALMEAAKLPIDADMIVNAAKPAIDAIGINPETVKKGVETLLDGVKDELLKIRAGKESEVLDDAEYVYDQIKNKVHELLEPIKNAIKTGGKALEKIQNTEYYQNIEDDIERRLKKIVKLALTGKYSYDDMKLIMQTNFDKIKENVDKQKNKAKRDGIEKALDFLVPKSEPNFIVEETEEFVKDIMHSDSFDGLDRVDSFFAHHGIKGQKWGIRRFQNEDGTLTEEGLKRYGHDYDNKGRLKRSAKKDDEKLIKDMRKVYDLHRKSRVASMKASNRLVDMAKEDRKAGKHITDASDDKKLDKHIGKMEKYAAKREDELEKIMVDYISKNGTVGLDEIVDIADSK